MSVGFCLNYDIFVFGEKEKSNLPGILILCLLEIKEKNWMKNTINWT